MIWTSVVLLAYISTYIPVKMVGESVELYMDGIMHKWANPHFDNFEKKSRYNMKYSIKRINTN